MDVFQKKAQAEFVDYSELWIDFMASRFPECHETADAKIYLDTVIKNSEQKQMEQIDYWVEAMNLPLDTKKCKYAKAIERITGTSAVIYHALMYKDIHSLKESMTMPIIERVQLFSKYSTLEAEDQHSLCRFLQKMSEHAFEAKGLPAVKVPTREEISQNIKSKKTAEKTEEPPSMMRAFQTHINGIFKHMNAKSPLESCDDATVREWITRWSSFANAKTNEVSNSTLCQAKDVNVLAQLEATVPELAGVQTHCDDYIWKNIHQLNGFSAVSENIPTKMMSRIEDMASRLADDIVSGRTDMASVNLQDIGQQVLAGCDESDMSKFAGNIESLLPALQAMQQSRPC